LDQTPILLALVEAQPHSEAATLALGWLQANWTSSLSQAHPQALDWQALGCCSQVLALVQTQPLPSETCEEEEEVRMLQHGEEFRN
jgi:hypothetical protein